MFFFFQAEDGIRDAQESRGLGDVYKRQIIFNIGDIPIDEKYTIDDYYVEYMKHAQEAYQAGITHERLYYDLAFFGAEKATMIERPKGYKRPINFYQIKNTIWGHDSLFFDFGYVLYSLNKSRLSPEAKSLLDLMSDAYWDMDYINIMEDSKFAKTDWGKLFKERYKKWHIRQHPFMPLRFMYENRDVTDLCPDDALRAVVLNSTVKHENAGVISQIIYCFGKGNYRYDMKFLNNIIKY